MEKNIEDGFKGESASQIGSRRDSLNSKLRVASNLDAFSTAEEFETWGEWIEVAQILDLAVLIGTVASMFILPIIFYRY